jgi:hypothetical protein
MLQAYVAVSKARGQALTAAGQPVAQPVLITALVDTGASCTCVDPAALAQLQLTPTGSVSLATPTTGSGLVSADQYDVALIIPAPNGQPLLLETIPVVASQLKTAQGFDALIGRDILGRCILNYNGDAGLFTLAF